MTQDQYFTVVDFVRIITTKLDGFDKQVALYMFYVNV